jgi:hypothetical protein
VLNNALAVKSPGIDAEGEVGFRFGHRHLSRPQSSSASRLTAGACGFLRVALGAYNGGFRLDGGRNSRRV